MLKVAFFTEAGKDRGWGHLIRSYTIYQEFKHLDADFYIDSNINFDEKMDNLQYFKWRTLEVQTRYDIIFIDSYEANLETYKMLQEASKICVYIDDYARLRYPKGVIINFAPDAAELFYKEQKKEYTYMLGLDYIPIRKEFVDVEVCKKKQIFIMLGGSDIANLSVKILEELSDMTIHKIVVHNNKKVAQELQKFENVTVLYKPDDLTLIQAMKSSSLAITTASMSSYELSFIQIPTILIALTKNQQDGMAHLLKHHIAYDAVSTKNKNFLTNLKKKITNKNFQLSNKIDAKGTQRIYKKIMDLL